MHSPGSIPMAFLGFLHSPLAEQLQCVPLWCWEPVASSSDSPTPGDAPAGSGLWRCLNNVILRQ